MNQTKWHLLSGQHQQIEVIEICSSSTNAIKFVSYDKFFKMGAKGGCSCLNRSLLKLKKTNIYLFNDEICLQVQLSVNFAWLVPGARLFTLPTLGGNLWRWLLFPPPTVATTI